jgi:hypothetical protein
VIAVKGHGLLREGAAWFGPHGNYVSPALPLGARQAKCQCGHLFPAGLSKRQAQAAHRSHKAEVLARQEVAG